MKHKKIEYIFFFLCIVSVGSLSFAGYMWYRADLAQKTPTQTNDAEVAELLATVGKLIVLPSNETPTLATIIDPAKLKDQPFFVNAQAGDKILIYTKAGKAILYSPGRNKIVDIAPVNIGPSTAAATTPTVANPTPTPAVESVVTPTTTKKKTTR